MNDFINEIDEFPYNSRLIKNYIEYAKEVYPELAVDAVLDYAGITNYELEDQGHWLSQRQIDRFHKIFSQKTGDPHISRKVGRFAASSKASTTFRQYALGFITPLAAYKMVEKVASKMTTATEFHTKGINRSTIEITVKTKKRTMERPYQCDNRWGLFESIGKVLTGEFPEIEHSSCIHKGGEVCRYIVKLKNRPFRVLRMGGNYFLAFSFLSSLTLLFFLSISNWFIFTLLSSLITMTTFFYSEFLEKRDQKKIIETQGNAARDLLGEMKIRYNNASLMQEIGQATREVLNIDEVVKEVTGVMGKRLDFDRGMILLPNRNKTRLLFNSGYGYDKKLGEILSTTEFHLDKPQSKGIAVETFKKQTPFLVNDINDVTEGLSEKSLSFLRATNANSFICVPIVYENESLGIIIVDNIKSKRSLTQSDMNLIKGIASQTAVNIAKALSFQKIQESEEKYRTILEVIEEGYFEVDLAGDLTFFNDAICKILGYSPSRLMGMSYMEYTDSETSARMFKVFNEIYRTGVPGKIIDYQVIREDGGVRTLELSASLLSNSAGEPTGFRGVIRDVTDKKQAEVLNREKLAAEAASRAKSQFLAIMSHEIRTPLNGIIGMTELAMMTDMDSKQGNILKTIEAESNSLLSIINDVLDFSKIEAEMLELEETSFDLASMVDNLVNSFAHRARQKGLKIRASLAPDAPSSIIGDPARLRQILTNLVANAVKFTPKGEIDIEVQVAEDLGKGVKLRFSVRDTGIGIPEDKKEAIFESFTQADSSTTRKYGGTGLGISISKHLAELMGGEIGVESEAGVGSCFWFTAIFPGKTVEKSATIRNDEKPVINPNQEGMLLKSIKILLVEDYPTNQEVAMAHLNMAGYHVDLAENGLAALALYRKNHYHLILMDLQMPVMDGNEATREIRKLEIQNRQTATGDETSDHQGPPGNFHSQSTTQRLPIIAMTGHAVEGYREECIAAGMDDYITKPLTRKRFLAMVEKWTGSVGSGDGEISNRQPTPQPNPIIPDTSGPVLLSGKHQSEKGLPMDFERALNEFEENEALLMEILKGFIENVRGQIGVIQQALMSQDADRVRREAHSIKGGAANLRADRLSRIASELEIIGKSGKLQKGSETLGRLEKELFALEKFEKPLVDRAEHS